MFPQRGVIDLPSRQINDFATKKKQNKLIYLPDLVGVAEDDSALPFWLVLTAKEYGYSFTHNLYCLSKDCKGTSSQLMMRLIRAPAFFASKAGLKIRHSELKVEKIIQWQELKIKIL